MVWQAEYFVVLGLSLLHPFPADPLLGGGALRLLGQVLVLDHLPDLVSAFRWTGFFTLTNFISAYIFFKWLEHLLMLVKVGY